MTTKSDLRFRPRRTVPKVLQLSGAPEVSARYRIRRLGELLELAGKKPTQLSLAELESWDNAPASADKLIAGHDLVILHRFPHISALDSLLEAARSSGVPVAWETDDLVFVPGIERWVAGVDRLGAKEREHYLEGVERYERAFRAADFFLGSTPFLAQVARRLGKKAFVLPNSLCPAFLRRAERIRSASAARDAAGDVPPVVGYGAGTATHDRDFLEVAPALERLLQRHPRLEIHVFGDVAIPEALWRFGPRIQLHEAVAWAAWPEVLSTFQINIAPLERGNPYCRAKSALKYIEAACLAVPTVASDVDSYRQAIAAGENGFLAATPEEWETALETLITSSDLRRQIGENARQEVLSRLAPGAASKDMLDTLDLLLRPGEPEFYERYVAETIELEPFLDVAWLIPTPFHGSGGHNDIFQICHGLERRNIRNTLHVEISGNSRLQKPDDVRALIHDHFVPLESRVCCGWQDVAGADLAVATHWSSVSGLLGSSWRVPPCYFVQDFEPLFYRPGDPEYWQAENTYRMGLNGITLGPWLAAKLREEYGSAACHWDFPIDRRFYNYNGGGYVPNRLLFFAQPGKARRAYELGVEALKIVAREVPSAEMVMFGSDQIETASLPFPARNLGVLTNSQLAEIYRSSCIGFALSYTNPSLVPVSMLACGCPVVDLDVEPNARTYPRNSGVLLAAPHPEQIAEALCRVLSDSSLREELSQQGLSYTRDMSFDRCVQQVESAILRAYLTGTVAHSYSLDFFHDFGDSSAELKDGACVLQSFRCGVPVLERIDVRLTHHGRPTEGGVQMVLYDQHGRVLRRVSRRADGLDDLAWVPFRFAPISDVAGERLFVALTGPGNAPGRSPGVIYSRRCLSGELRLSIDDDIGAGALAMRTYGFLSRRLAVVTGGIGTSHDKSLAGAGPREVPSFEASNNV